MRDAEQLRRVEGAIANAIAVIGDPGFDARLRGQLEALAYIQNCIEAGRRLYGPAREARWGRARKPQAAPETTTAGALVGSRPSE